jgi:hypothetical protein
MEIDEILHNLVTSVQPLFRLPTTKLIVNNMLIESSYQRYICLQCGWVLLSHASFLRCDLVA